MASERFARRAVTPDPIGEEQVFESGEHQCLRPTSRPNPAALQYQLDHRTTSTGALRSTVPPTGDFTSLDAPLVLPESTFFGRLDDLARRIEMVTALVQAGGLSQAQGSRAVQSALRSVATNAEEGQVHSLGAAARALQHAVAALDGGVDIDAEPAFDVLVFDESELSRDFAAIALATQGHVVRCAQTYEEFIDLLGERLPDLVIAEVVYGKTPPASFCAVLAELLEARGIGLFIYSALAPTSHPALRRLSRARAIVSKDDGLPALMAQLTVLLSEGSVPPGGRAPGR